MKKILILAIIASLATFGCKVLRNINLIPESQDKELGQQLNLEIQNNPKEYPLLQKKGNEAAYAYVEKLVKNILNSGQIKHKDDYPWDVSIIDNDTILNAFASPGGYVYVYTGLIKFLDSEDQLIGVLGHEIAHADLRHSTSQMSQRYGTQLSADILLGKNAAMVKEIVSGLAGLSYSRNHESQADEYAVRYTCGTEYNAKGVAGFFEKMKGRPSPPQFLSTHPNPENRVKAINKLADSLKCGGRVTNEAAYALFKKKF
ncbi:MAG: M48 family metalloprotease [Saprospiraceae bacterium]|nr:M48 family metalloprotease [Saprospiraceae bacterium]